MGLWLSCLSERCVLVLITCSEFRPVCSASRAIYHQLSSQHIVAVVSSSICNSGIAQFVDGQMKKTRVKSPIWKSYSGQIF